MKYSSSILMAAAASLSLTVASPLAKREAAPAPTAAAVLAERAFAMQTKTITRDGVALTIALADYTDLSTQCGLGHNTDGPCAPTGKQVVKVTRTLPGGTLFISDEVRPTPAPNARAGALPPLPAGPGGQQGPAAAVVPAVATGAARANPQQQAGSRAPYFDGARAISAPSGNVPGSGNGNNGNGWGSFAPFGGFGGFGGFFGSRTQGTAANGQNGAAGNGWANWFGGANPFANGANPFANGNNPFTAWMNGGATNGAGPFSGARGVGGGAAAAAAPSSGSPFKGAGGAGFPAFGVGSFGGVASRQQN